MENDALKEYINICNAQLNPSSPLLYEAGFLKYL